MRAATAKAFLPLGGKPLFSYSLRTLCRLSGARSLVLVVPPDLLAEARDLVASQEPWPLTIEVTAGGAERQDSVAAGLRCAGNADLVLVHDAARPFVSLARAAKCAQVAATSGAAILALPASDTVKRVEAGITIRETVDRSQIWLAQTPQVFRTELLRQAYKRAREEHISGTDDASLVERLGVQVRVVEGDEENRKITTPADLRWAEWHLGAAAAEA
jgi:2-C-methyl-D-erythritol 4-phosphate cytidylyltransferase